MVINQKSECEKRDLNISDQFETLMHCSTIHFLGTNAQLSQKPATESSFKDKKHQGLQFSRVKF